MEVGKQKKTNELNYSEKSKPRFEKRITIKSKTRQQARRLAVHKIPLRNQTQHKKIFSQSIAIVYSLATYTIKLIRKYRFLLLQIYTIHLASVEILQLSIRY